LRTAEQRVADFILKHAEELIYLTVTELAERTQTSESTVVRLCQKIGYKGYQEFKIMLARDLVGPTETVYQQIDPGDSLETLKGEGLPGQRSGAQGHDRGALRRRTWSAPSRRSRTRAASRSTGSAAARRSRSTPTTSS
jgi:hypothetical protein